MSGPGSRLNASLRSVTLCVGQFSMEGAHDLVGFTFADHLSFSPFVETPEQADRDIAAGFTYLQGDVAANVENVTKEFPMPPNSAVLRSPKDATTWATPLTETRYKADWMIGFDPDTWRHLVSVEHPGYVPDFVT